MKQSNYGTLVFFKDPKFQHRNKWYEYDHYQPVHCPLNQLPPFQHPLTAESSAVFSFQIVNVEDNQFFEIRNDLTLAGMRQERYLATEVYPEHQKLIYPAISKFPGTFKSGLYYAIMKTNSETWYSEHFVMNDFVGEDDFIYLEWLHARNYKLYPQVGHFIDYSKGYKNFLYIKSDIGKPEWFYEEEEDNRDGDLLPIHQVKFKMCGFQIIVSEYFLDILAEIPLHDCVVIKHQGHTYQVDKFIMNQPSWFPQGAKASVRLQFRYNTTTIVSGRGVVDGYCSVAEGDCYEDVLYQSEALIEWNSSEYLGFYYLDDQGQQVAFQDGEYALVEYPESLGGGHRIERYDQGLSTFVAIDPTASQLAYNKEDKTYWQSNPASGKWVGFAITSYSATSVQGTGIDNSTVEVIGVIGTTEVSIGVITIDQFRSGYTFSLPGIEAVKVIASSGLCSEVYTSAARYLDTTPETPDTPEPDFPPTNIYSDEIAAQGAGLTSDDSFLQDPLNSTQGLPGCILRTIVDPDGTNGLYPVYNSFDEAIEMGENRPFALGLGNPYGMPAGVICVASKGYTVYDTEDDARNDGVAQGEPYLLSGEMYGFGDHGAFVAVMDCEL